MNNKDKFFRKLQVKFAGYKPQQEKKSMYMYGKQFSRTSSYYTSAYSNNSKQQFKNGKQFIIDQILYKFYLQFKGIQILKKHLQNLINHKYNTKIDFVFAKTKQEIKKQEIVKQRVLLDYKCLLSEYKNLERYKQQLTNLQYLIYEAIEKFFEIFELSEAIFPEDKLYECLLFIFNEEGKVNSIKQALTNHYAIYETINAQFQQNYQKIDDYVKKETQVYRDIVKKLEQYKNYGVTRKSKSGRIY